MSASPAHIDSLRTVILQHWGFDSFRPLQEDAMRAFLDGRDSLLVLPTGGGKSLCYQAPAVVRGDTTVVVSPLISLMKDQVDALRSNGVPAVQMNSSQGDEEREMATYDALQGNVRLLFVAPERLVMPSFQQLLMKIGVQRFGIDEAHCISHWGHDFRPEYRQLSQLKEQFPQASVHGFTATATERVRKDIIQQLRLKNPALLVGNFDRPNLTYRVLPRMDATKQVCEVIDRHKGEAGIVYCIRRKDVDALAMDLHARKYKVMPYHAGLSADLRKKAQDAFAAEACDLIVATVAFGMGIDRSNVRFVLHTGMPKSIEHYQQETGRAGRDGLEAECVLLYSGQDVVTWKWLIEKSAEEAEAANVEAQSFGDGEPRFGPKGAGPDAAAAAIRHYVQSAHQHLEEMDRYARGAICRHKALVGYFGQAYERDNCEACDHCLGDTEPVPDALVIAQKILSCVARVKERWGAGHVISVLRGENTEKVRANQHEQLSTYGLLREHSPGVLRNWIQQLIGQQVLVQDGNEYPILKLNAGSWEVMKGQRQVKLVQPVQKERMKQAGADLLSWDGVDRELFDALRELRKRLAEEKQVPAYVVFSDNTLRELAQVRPSSLDRMKYVYGIGEQKLTEFGAAFLAEIDKHCQARSLSRDQQRVRAQSEPKRAAGFSPAAKINPQRSLAFSLYAQGAGIDDVVLKTGRSRSTATEYLAAFILETKPGSIRQWIDDAVYQQIAAAVQRLGSDFLKPVFIELGEKVAYDDIRVVIAHLQSKR